MHFCINTAFPPVGLQEIDDVDYFGTFTETEAAKMGVAVSETIESEDGGSPPNELDKGKAGLTQVRSV